MDNLVEVIGFISGILTVSSFIPQTLKTYRTKDVSGLSLIMYSLFNLGTIGWITYGYLRESWPLMIFNSITFVFAFPVLLMIIKYSKNKNLIQD